MPQNRSYKKKTARSPYLFIALVLVLLTAALILGTRAMNTWKVYEAEAAVTPAPTSTVRPISVTPDPARVTPPPTAVPTPAPSPTPGLLNSGSQGGEVRRLQVRLQDLGYYRGSIDGDYGTGTKTAVQTFQKINGLDADGIAGQKTLTALYSESAKPAPGPVDTLAEAMPLLVNAWNPLPEGFEPANLVRVKDVAAPISLNILASTIHQLILLSFPYCIMTCWRVQHTCPDTMLVIRFHVVSKYIEGMMQS